jgi:hypothetical protein
MISTIPKLNYTTHIWKTTVSTGRTKNYVAYSIFCRYGGLSYLGSLVNETVPPEYTMYKIESMKTNVPDISI